MQREEKNTPWESEDNPQGRSAQGNDAFKGQSTQGEGATQGAFDDHQDTEDRDPGYSPRVVDYDRGKQSKWRKALVICGIAVMLVSIGVVVASKSNTYPSFSDNLKAYIATAQSRLKGDRALVICGIAVMLVSIGVVVASKSNTYPSFSDNLKAYIATAQSRLKGDSTTTANTTEEQRARYQRALDTAKSLPVVELDTKSKYKRVEQFGEAWKDVDGNGCDTRNDILKRDLRDVTTAGRNNCRVTSGVFDDPYTGKTIHFKFGKDTSSAVQIDHVVCRTVR